MTPVVVSTLFYFFVTARCLLVVMVLLVVSCSGVLAGEGPSMEYGAGDPLKVSVGGKGGCWCRTEWLRCWWYADALRLSPRLTMQR